MIDIPFDEAKAYDELSILSVKAEKRPEIRADWDRLMTAIIAQVPAPIHARIMAEVYPLMWAMNSACFSAVDATPDDDPVKSLNQQRYELKRHLQQRFFPEKALTEVKL